MKSIASAIVCLVLFNFNVYSQGKVEVNLGAGFMESGGIKIKYGNNFQVGICQGFLFSDFWMTGVEVYYHIAGISKFVDQRPYYVMGGTSATLFPSGYGTFEKIVLYPRFGRTFSFSKSFGANLDAGLGLLLADDIDGYHSTFTPTCSIHLFIRL